MAKQNEPFRVIEAESFYDEAEKKVRVRPCPDGIYPTTLLVECPREMRDTKRYPLGTRFRIRVKLTDREGSKDFVYSYHGWPCEVL